MTMKKASAVLLLLASVPVCMSFLCCLEPAYGTEEHTNANEQIQGLIREPLVLNVRLPDGKTATLDAFVTRPDKEGRWPIALITHGTAGDSSDRSKSPNRFSSAAIAFARHGYASVVVMRQGYGQSSGVTESLDGTCLNPNHARAGKIAAADLIAALQAIRLQPWSLPNEAIAVGVSSGGFSVLATGAANPPGLGAIINFDGGRGATGVGKVCGKEQLVASINAFGSLSRVPALWIYAHNDNVFRPALGKALFDGYIASGGVGEFFEAPAYGNNGHSFFAWSPERLWWDRVADFLSQYGLPSAEIVPLPVVDIPAPSKLGAPGKEAFRTYVESRAYEKAFATNGRGAWGVSKGERTQTEASTKAIDFCQKKLKSDDLPACAVYATGNHLAAETQVHGS